MTNQNKSFFFAISAILLWSTVATSFKIALNSLNYYQTLFFSILTALFVFFVILIIEKKLKSVFVFTKKQILYSALLGLVNPFLYYLILFKAYSLLPAQLAQPLNYTWPLMLVIFSIIFLKQKFKVFHLFSIFISFIGVVLISLKGSFFNIKIDEPFGILLATGSSVFWATYWIFNMKDERDEIVKLFLNFAFGLVYITIYIFSFSEFKIPSTEAILSTSYIGLFEMGITFWLWLKALKYSKTTAQISNLVYISPFLSLIFIHFILHETIYFTTIVGLILIIVGILLQNLIPIKKSE